MKKFFAIAALTLVIAQVAAQETYENAKLVENDLNGTARYVGMGGALEALGADISTISSNPAGIGLFRKSSANLSFGFVSQQDGKAFGGGHPTNMSFDQVGFVYATRTSSTGYLNFGFNYHKSKNFDYILQAADRLSGASQNKLTFIKTREGLTFPLSERNVPNFDKSFPQCNQLDYMLAPNINYDGQDDQGFGQWFYDDATYYTMNRSHTGYIGEYDFNISGNINNRVYLGMTLGLHDVHYKHYSEYTEQFDAYSPIQVADDREITGQGGDLKFGIIFRPVEMSPFRVGLSVTTPTWFDLTTRNYTTMADDGGSVYSTESYDFKLYTPWKFGLSLGHTIGNTIALGASYEYADYGTMDTRYKTGGSYDWWTDSYYDRSESDNVMNRHTAETLRGVSTLKLGAEFKAAPEVAVRFGYNYVAPMYEEDGFKDGALDSEGSYYSSATDYTNWDATHRFTCGLGFQLDKLNLSMAYQYSAQNGHFEPFMSWVDQYDESYDNIADQVKVSNKRHQLLLTATYTF